jgi:hypothetical protein
MANKPLNKKQKDYLEWLILPKEDRIPNTKVAYAKELGVTEQALRVWEKLPEFKELFEVRLKSMAASPERTHMLLDSLFNRGLNGDTRAADLYFKAIGAYPDPKATINIKKESARELSDDELQSLIAEYASREIADRQSRPAEQLDEFDGIVANLDGER